MNEVVNPAPPVLPADPVHIHGVGGCTPAGDAETAATSPCHRALFTATSMRSEFVSLYPELDQVCDQLGFGDDMSIGQWNSDPSWALLILARAAEAPRPASIGRKQRYSNSSTISSPTITILCAMNCDASAFSSAISIDAIRPSAT